MAQKILVFESDQDFAEEVEATLHRYGVSVAVATDGADGLERAEAEQPDAILLSVQLPTVNGFLVCKRIKKHASLKTIPTIILSSDADAPKIFEQHRKLRTHAEDYIQKPVSMDELMQRIGSYVELKEPAAGNGDAGDADVDEEIDAFAESAFDSLVMEDSTPAPSVSNGASEPSAHVAVTMNPEPDDEPELDLEPESHPPDTAQGEDLSVAGGESDDGRLDAAQAAQRAAEKRAAELAEEVEQLREASSDQATSATEVSALQGQVEALEARLKAAESSVDEKPRNSSSHELLDLRQSLNTKDKEILGLRDEVTARDKQLLDLRDKSLAMEREKADLEEQVSRLESDLTSHQQEGASLKDNLQAAQKREQDFKQRFERAQERADSLMEAQEKALAEATQEHEETLARLAADHAARGEADQAKHAAALASQAEEAQGAQEAALQVLRDQLSRENAETLGRLQADADAALKETEDKLRVQFETEKQSALGEASDKHARELAVLGRKLTETEAELEAKLSEIASLEQKAAELSEALEVRTKERNGLQTDVNESRKRIDELQTDRDALSHTIQGLEGQVSGLDKRIRSAHAKIETDSEILGKVRKAVEIATVLLEDQSANALDD